MAVDFWHRLIITGRRGAVELLRRQLRRKARPSVAGRKLRRETIPFSFERLYQLVPAAVRIEPQVPSDPYDLSAWPIRRLPRELAELRYQLHTRNIELLPFVRLLSKEFTSLMFCLVTFCLDDGEVASYQVYKGRVRKWILPEARREAHWERARQSSASPATACMMMTTPRNSRRRQCSKRRSITGNWRRKNLATPKSRCAVG